jgi:hypothetical protein
MFRAFPGASPSLTLQCRVSRAHDALPEVIEAVGRMVSNFFGQIDSPVALLEMCGEI